MMTNKAHTATRHQAPPQATEFMLTRKRFSASAVGRIEGSIRQIARAAMRLPEPITAEQVAGLAVHVATGFGQTELEPGFFAELTSYATTAMELGD